MSPATRAGLSPHGFGVGSLAQVHRFTSRSMRSGSGAVPGIPRAQNAAVRGGGSQVSPRHYVPSCTALGTHTGDDLHWCTTRSTLTTPQPWLSMTAKAGSSLSAGGRWWRPKTVLSRGLGPPARMWMTGGFDC